MNFQSNKLRDAVLVALVAGVASTATAQAQEATNLDRISVTGSRIKSTDIETSQPVLSLTRADIEKQGVTSVADILQRVAANGAALNRTYNNGGDGSAGVSLRNLGSERTLVLVNGRRWTTGLDGSVDLNTIPTAMIERIDILKDGASTIYGSDAIAGVVNIITKQSFDGAEANFYKGQYSAGDGEREAADFTLGTTTDRASLVLGVSYVNEKAVMAGDRKISAGGPPFFSGQSSTGIPGSYLRNDERYVILNGVETPFDPNVHGYNTAPDNYLLTPNERTSLFAVGSYNVTDNITFRTEAMYNERKSEQLLAAMPVTGQRLSAGSMYNPYGVDLTGVARRFNETGGRSFNQNVKNWHFYGGFEGFFEFADRNFDWDVGYRYDKTDQNDLTYGLFNKQRLAEAYGPSAIRDGKAVCLNSAGAIIAGCAPINPLGGMGSISQEALDYTSFTAHDSASLVSKGYYANISGEIVQLPAGALGFAAGYEYRKESGQFDPDAFIASGLSTGNGAAPTKGGYDLDEFFLELSIPVLADLPGAKLLDFSAATRYSKYSNFGNTTNNKFGFRWKPIDDLMVRGNYSEGFRAPSINNLYRGDADSFETYIDPCSSTSGRRTGAVAAQCAAEGVPIGFVQPGAGSGAKQTPEPFTWQANPNLKPETSTSKTLGLVWSPSFVQGLNVTLDWWQIKIEDAITRPAIQDIMDRCYGGTAQEQAANCGLITRDPNYGSTNQRYTITNVNMPLQNLASYKVEGWDLGILYKLPETSIGQFTISLDGTYLSKWDTKSTQDAPIEGRQGRYLDQDPYWRIRSNLYVDWSYGDFGVNYGIRYKSGMTEPCPFDPDEEPETFAYCSDGAKGTNHIGATTYHDIQFRYNTPWKGTIMVGLNNAWDKSPPVSYYTSYNMFDPQYDLPGRYMYMQYKQKF
ncbi:TonB-dependent receptor plug domain-containing protein [Stenotrophomonas geniculata]|jgi:iron complex outermembrane recepter protein|uniref:TonB-dependent receptor plug domain-containing protein n=1 Tax=Stenotrophomonas TaxID=40323 RepID=UPI00066EABB6|nr:TonB-dependent receptor [Stenotrophomonas geniculata]ALA87565.1 TonB-dependent receptor [Stenotrophomonas maltophilia]ALA91521.1 TonB-dependent receptor [Stenotrophomonas maltophilia]MBN5131831.1 TonB-dependent receptor [Stenotrophomonas maltophilia]MBN5135418.1 TonB-dependent receptor [Stenotrophomonas maltophilia]MBO0395961.1 TonB-dependent receptor [Stenotrophomonas maltophilia]